MNGAYNSAANPRNPSTPPTRVKWGEGSLDEMGSVGLMLVAADEADAPKLKEAIRRHTLQAAAKSRLRGDPIDWKAFGAPGGR